MLGEKAGTDRMTNTTPVEPQGRDRRREDRAPVDVWVEEEMGNELYFRRTGNVSVGGIYFEQSIPHPLGTRVKLRFSLPGEAHVIAADGEIVNTPGAKNGLGMGLRFLHIDDVDRGRIRAFVRAIGQGDG